MPKDVAELERLLRTLDSLRIQVRERLNAYTGTLPARDLYVERRDYLVQSEILVKCLPSWIIDTSSIDDAVADITSAIPSESRLPTAKKCRQFLESSLVSAYELLRRELYDSYIAEGDHFSSPQRIELGARVGNYFGKRIDFDDSVFQVLSRAPTARSSSGIHPITRLWRSAVQTNPHLASAVCMLLDAHGIPFSSILSEFDNSKYSTVGETISDRYIYKVLEASFFSKRHLGRYTEDGKNVIKKQKITLFDILRSTIYNPDVGDYSIPILSIIRRLSKNGAELPALRAQLLDTISAAEDYDQGGGYQRLVLIQEKDGFRIGALDSWGPVGIGKLGKSSDALELCVLNPHSNAYAELEELINSDAHEGYFQRFFEDNPQFLEALGPYQSIKSHVVLEGARDGALVPDFFLQNSITGFSDICELKRPSNSIIKGPSRRRQFKDGIMTAVRQLQDYRDYFDETRNRHAFEERYPRLRAFRPKAILVVGRSADFESPLERARMESRLEGWLTLRTYDDVLAIADVWMRNLSSRIERRSSDILVARV